MAELLYEPAADAALDALQADPDRGLLWNRVVDVLEALEANPGDRLMRRRALRTPHSFTTVWAVPASGGREDWMVLWIEHPKQDDTVIVVYVGPAALS
jgi:hypothetical protein